MNRIQILLFPIVVLLSILVQKNLSGQNQRAIISPPQERPPAQEQAHKPLPLMGLVSAAESGGMIIKGAVFGAGQFARDVAVGYFIASSQARMAAESVSVPAYEELEAPIISCAHNTAEKVQAEVFLIKNARTGEEIFSQNTDKLWSIASITKLMTATIAMEKIDINKEVRISAHAAATYGIVGGFQEGELFTVRDLIKAMLVTSSNDAAVAIAEQIGERKFVDAMQNKAAELKMLNTTYVEPTGLSPLNRSTANDLTKLVYYAIDRHPEFFLISRQRETKIVELETGKARTLANISQFAGNGEFLGGKTGFIDESGRNLVALFGTDSHLVLTIMLGAENAIEETKTLLNLCSISTQ